MPEHTDSELAESTRRWMSAGAILMFLFVLAFPLYRLYEPEARAAAREQQLSDLRDEGQNVYLDNCSSCHGQEGEGVDAPALNSRQFLFNATLDQIASIVGHGIPGSEMVAWSVDFNGPLTSEQINAVATYVDSWRSGAPDRPDWRTPEG